MDWPTDIDNANVLARALHDAGVELVDGDHRLIGWLARWEPHVADRIARWITRGDLIDREALWTAEQAR